MNSFDAISFFRSLTEKNRLCRANGFAFTVVSDLEGFSQTLEELQLYRPLVAVSDCSEGVMELDNAPSTRRIHTVFLFMPHDIQNNWIANRAKCLDIMREIFRQYMSVLLREIVNIRLDGIYIDRSISFQEISRYFFSGGACAYFQIASDITTDLRLNLDEWTDNPIPEPLSRLDVNTPMPSTTLS